MNTVSAQLWKGQHTAGTGVRVVIISSCPSAREQERSLSLEVEDPGGIWEVEGVGGVQLQCLDNIISC